MKLIVQRDGVGYEREIDADHRLGLMAESVRQERTGVHARVSILMNYTALAWGLINIERDEDRVRIVNSAWAHLSNNGVATIYPKNYLKADMDGFCAEAWPSIIKSSMPEAMAGSDERRGPSFRLRPYIIEGGGTILFAPPGRGKSYLALLMAVSLDGGLVEHWDTNIGRVLFINLERSKQSLEQRLGNVNKVLGLPRSRPLLTLNARGRSLFDVLPAAERAVQEQHIECVWLDSISRAGYGDLNENAPVNRIVDALNGLVSTWAGIAHTPRADDSHVYGSMHFEAGADVMVRMLSQQEQDGPLGIGLEIAKQNDIGPTPMHIWALEFDDMGLTNFRRAKEKEFPEIEARKPGSLKQRVKDHLLDVGKASAPEIAEAIGEDRPSVSRILATNNDFVSLGKDGRKKLYGMRFTG